MINTFATPSIGLRVFGRDTPILETHTQAHLVESFCLWCYGHCRTI